METIRITEEDLKEFSSEAESAETEHSRLQGELPASFCKRDPRASGLLKRIPGQVYQVRVTMVSGPDMFETTGLPPLLSRKVRLTGVDGPDQKDIGFRKAVVELEKYVEGKEICLVIDNRWKYDSEGITLGYAITGDGLFINAYLLKKGYGWLDLSCSFDREMEEYFAQFSSPREEMRRSRKETTVLSGYASGVKRNAIQFGGSGYYELIGVEVTRSAVEEFLEDLLFGKSSGQKKIKILTSPSWKNEEKKRRSPQFKGYCQIFLCKNDLSEFLLTTGLATKSIYIPDEELKVRYTLNELSAKEGFVGYWRLGLLSVEAHLSYCSSLRSVLEKMASALSFDPCKIAEWQGRFVSFCQRY